MNLILEVVVTDRFHCTRRKYGRKCRKRSYNNSHVCNCPPNTVNYSTCIFHMATYDIIKYVVNSASRSGTALLQTNYGNARRWCTRSLRHQAIRMKVTGRRAGVSWIESINIFVSTVIPCIRLSKQSSYLAFSHQMVDADKRTIAHRHFSLKAGQ